MEATKKCLYCNKFYAPDRFGVALTTSQKVYRRQKCSNCYRETKQKLIQKHLSWINDYKKEKGCTRCGNIDPRVLDFHHRNGKDKLFGLGTFRRAVGFERIKKEVEKCEIVCANCHRILHYEMRQENTKNGA